MDFNLELKEMYIHLFFNVFFFVRHYFFLLETLFLVGTYI